MTTPHPENIFEWTAKRAGAAITISGKTSTGNDVKVAGITSIERVNGKTIARHHEGDIQIS